MKFIKRLLPLIILLVFIFSCSAPQDTEIQNLKILAQKHIPDFRVEIFDVNPVEDTIFVRTSNQAVYDELMALEKNNISLTLLPEESLEKQFGVINLSAAHLRKENNHESEMITQSILGTPVRIFDKNRSWYKIQTPDNYIGWIDDYGVHPMTTEEMDSWNQAEKIIFLNHAGFVYAQENCNGDIVSDIVLGNMLKLLTTTENFYKVEFPDGRFGFVKKSEAKTASDWFDNRELTGESLVNMGKKFMGIPYLWGGASAKALDCSGFVKTVYWMHGIVLKRDASQQVLYGEEISMDDDYQHLQKGDLLFFGSNPKRISHVGMYIGNKEFIHEAGRVKINSLDKEAENYSGYRASSFRAVRRIIGSENSTGITTYKTNEFYK